MNFKQYAKLFDPQGFNKGLMDVLQDKTAANQMLGSNATTGHFIAKVIEFFPYINCYLVLTGGQASMIAVNINSGSSVPIGQKDNSNIAIGSTVLCYNTPEFGSVAYILGTVPEQILGSFSDPDAFVKISGGGLFKEPATNYIISQKISGGLKNFNDEKPIDLYSTDWAKFNELGMGMLLGTGMLSMRGTDLSRIDLFYFDNLMRLYGYNLEFFTAGEERRAFNDQGEYTDVTMGSPYPWEMLGAANPGDTVTIQDLEANIAGPDASNDKVEPVEANQSPIARWLELKGYLGDLERKIVAVPVNIESPETLNSENKYFGVLDISTGMDGRYSIKSAKGIHLHKTLRIPVPKQKLLPDDPEGDRDNTYKFAGQFGTGDSHQKNDFTVEGGLTPAHIRDMHAYTFNYFDKIGLIKHKKDWDLPEDAELLTKFNMDEFTYKLTSLVAFEYSIPKFLTIKIDHRTTGRYYEVDAGIDILENGAVVITGGYGEQLVFYKGNITLTAPGDVITRPGRSAITWAPGDIVQRAGKSIDLSTTKNDIRIKAEKNVHVLAGNSNSGGVLIESRGTGGQNFEGVGEDVISNGVIIKSKDADTIIYGRATYVSSLGGNLYLNANQGADDIYTFSKQVLDFCKSSHSIYAGINPGQETPASQITLHSFGTSSSIIGSHCTIGGLLNVIPIKDYSGISVKGRLFLDGGDVVTTLSGDGDKYVKTGAQYGPADKTLTQFKDEVLSDIDRNVSTLHEAEAAIFISSSGPLSSTFITTTGFSFRDETQYNFNPTNLIYEADWQQRYRVNGITTVWAETAVLAPNGTTTMPHPGYTAWTSNTSYGTYDHKFINNDMTYKNRNSGTDYDDSTGNTVVNNVLNTSYIVTENL